MYYNVHVLVISMYASMKCLKISKGKSKKDSRYNGQKDKRINNDLQNISQETIVWATHTQPKTRNELGCSQTIGPFGLCSFYVFRNTIWLLSQDKFNIGRYGKYVSKLFRSEINEPLHSKLKWKMPWMSVFGLIRNLRRPPSQDIVFTWDYIGKWKK